MIFLGLASNYTAKDIWRHSFAAGTKKDYDALESALAKKYNSDPSRVSLIFSGRSAISLALKSFLASDKVEKGDHVAVNAFTCHAVLEAIKNAKLEPVFVDLEKTISGEILPNYSAKNLEELAKADKKLKVFILQNTFGFPVDIRQFEKVKDKYRLLLLEDLAHCAGRKYPDGREIGTVGEAACLSFGKGKSLDTTTGGAVVLRDEAINFPKSFNKANLKRREFAGGPASRASWYPFLAAVARGLSHLHLEKFWLGFLLKVHAIERSADTALREDTTVSFWQAKLALRQLNQLKNSPLREFYVVTDREACLKELKKHGYRLEEFWYEVPVAPERYYKKANFPVKDCPNAVFFAEHVVNLPTWYKSTRHAKEVAAAKKIIKTYATKGK
ncbi:DegT/DnrJ/EryC1/StrS aminotransferase family protein [Candidatus Saccharibacteria bacterium]|nr:DegT/DnrJ/EryC1/StrS aminotransferase family protein [Candidatus Saccharibacteria bacterium]